MLIRRYFKLVRDVTRRLANMFRSTKNAAIYEVSFGGKQPVRVLLAKALADQVIANRSEVQGSLQSVWWQVHTEVALDPKAYAGVKVPPLHVWRNMSPDGSYVVRLTYVRDARPDERKLADPHPVRDLVSGLLASARRLS